LAARGARRDLQLHLAVGRGHLDATPQRRFRMSDGHGEGEAVAAAAEDLARGDPDSDQHVTYRAAARSGRGLATQAKDRTVLDGGGDLQRQAAGAVLRAGTPALGARALDDPTRPAALGTWLGEGEEPLVLGDHTSAGAGGTGVDGGSRLGPRARAPGTRRRPLHLDGGGDAAGGVLEADAQVGLDVGTSLRTAPLAAPEPEHVAQAEASEEILKVFDANLL